LQEQRRPVLAQSRLEDPAQKIMFVDNHWVHAEGSRGVAESIEGSIYLALSLRNVGSGIAVCQGWVAKEGMATTRTAPTHTPEEEFRAQTRDLYIPGGDIGMWQGAIRSQNDPNHAELAEAIEKRTPISIELLYSDQVGGQRTISRFGLMPAGDEAWFASLNRHWHLDGPGPRDEAARLQRAEAILRERALQEESDEAAELAGPAPGRGPR